MAQAEQTQVAEVVGEFARRVRDENWESVALTVRISGGMPSQRRREEFELHGTGSVVGRYSDANSGRALREKSLTFDQAEIHQLFVRAAAGVAALVERSHIRFPPDSLVGSITVKVHDRQATVYFVPEEERFSKVTHLPSELRESIGRLRTAFQKLRSKDEQR